MNIRYRGSVRLQLKRVFPPDGNFCRLSVFANALNFHGYKKVTGKQLTPGVLLEEINKKLKAQNLEEINPHIHVVPTSELVGFYENTGIGSVKIVKGKRYLNFDLWHELLANNIVFSSVHQEVYYYSRRSLELTLKYIPSDLLQKMRKNERFSYDTLVEFYKLVLRKHGPLDHGHFDLALDMTEKDGEKFVVFANLNCVNHRPYIVLPWNLYKNYLAFDWESNDVISDVDEFPGQKRFELLRKNGSLANDSYEYTYGLVEIFYKYGQENTLKHILSRY